MTTFIEGEWGLPVTVIALLLIAAIFGSAFWFILSASRTNSRFRLRQLMRRWRRREGDDYQTRNTE